MTAIQKLIQQAKAAGEKTFFTGKPCRHGHVAPRFARATGECVECVRIREIERRDRDGDKRAAAERARYAANPTVMRERSRNAGRKHRGNNRDARNAYLRQWAADNSGRSSQIKARYRKLHPEQGRLDAQRRRCRIAGAEGFYTIADVERITAAQCGKCAYCKRRAPLTVDHIKAISKGGSNWPSNLCMACKSCNSRKHAKDPIEFMQSMGALL